MRVNFVKSRLERSELRGAVPVAQRDLAHAGDAGHQRGFSTPYN